MFIDKLGLSDGKTDVYPDAAISEYTPYMYTNIDNEDTFERIEICQVNINKPFKIYNGDLYIDDTVYSIGDKTIQDVYNIVNTKGTLLFFTGYELFRKLPAILLSNCSNTIVSKFDGNISPIDISIRSTNKSIDTISSIDSNIVVIDDYNGNVKEYNRIGSRVFFPPSNSTNVYITTLSTSFRLYMDFSPKRLTNTESVSKLLNYGERF